MTKPNIAFEYLKITGSDFDSFSVMKALSKRGKKFFMLEGFEEWDGSSPYSYLGTDPKEIISVRKGRLYRQSQKSEPTEIPGPLLENLTKYFESYRAAKPKKTEPAFRGGAVGFVGYECSKYFENAVDPFMKPSLMDAFFMVFNNTIGVAQDGSHILLSGAVFLDEESLESGRTRVERELGELKKFLISEQCGPQKKIDRTQALSEDLSGLDFISSLGREHYENGVRKIKDHIRAGDIFQCVLSDQFKTKLNVPPLSVYEILRATNPSPFMFYLEMEQETLLGASPERLVKIADSIIETNPIAGTRARGANLKEDKQREKHLLASTKEKAEHLMLVDLGRNDIGRVAKPGSVYVEDFMKVMRFSDVMHIISKVKGKLASGQSPWSALASCFPAGTLSGAPKIRAMEIISEIERGPRNFYGGAIVKYEFDGSLDSCIAIRCTKYRDHEYTFQAGAGIVADSNPAREYDEVEAKTKAVRRALVLAQRTSQ